MAKRVAAAACFAIFFGLFLSGCVARGPVMSQRSTELTATPFFPQKTHQCGPAALATVLVASGVDTHADALTSSLYIPARRGSLQVEMLATPRAFARLSMPVPRNPEAIVAELEAGRPVLVLHNYGLSFWPRWHYAVVVGYDPVADTFILRSGVKQRQEMRSRIFMVAWYHAARWAMVVLRPGELPASADAQSYLEAAAAFERGANPRDALAAFDAAVRRWPADAVALVGRGTAEYRLGDLRAAARDYARALRADPAQAGARNNLAQTLIELHCPNRARDLLGDIDISKLAPPMRAALSDTLSGAQAAAAGPDDPDCATDP